MPPSCSDILNLGRENTLLIRCSSSNVLFPLPTSFLPSFLSCPIHLFLTFCILYIISGTTNCFGFFVLFPFFLSLNIHIKIQKQTRSIHFTGHFLGLLIECHNQVIKNGFKKTSENPHSAFVPPPCNASEDRRTYITWRAGLNYVIQCSLLPC